MASRRKRDQDDDAKPAKLNKSTLRKFFRLFRYLRPYRSAFSIGMVLLLLNSMLGMVFPGLMGRLVDATKGDVPTDTEALFDLGNIDSVALLLLGVFALQAVLGFGRIYLFAYVTEHMLARLRQDTYEHVVKLPMHFFATRRVGELNSRISADVALLQDTFTTTLAELVRQVVIVIVGLVLLTRLSPQLTLTMLASVPVVTVVAVLFGRYIRTLSKEVQDRIADTNVVVDETLQGIQSVKAYANEAWEALRYGRSVQAARDLAMKGARWRGAFVSFIILCLFGAIVLVIWRGVHLKEEGVISTGELVTFILYSVFIGASIGSIPEYVTQVLKAVGATERLMDLHDEVAEPIDLGPKGAPLPIRGSITFEHVDFHYASRADMPVLRGVDLQVEPGQRIALVGPSGAGKSTLAALVLRFHDPVHGRVLIDGRPVANYPLTALRDRMAIVPQEVLLFGGTIRENIAYGKPGASDAEVQDAARKAFAHDFIIGFPEGYGTVVGERGVQLSGGQRQRIAIARAVLKDPAILILDEATSALDSESERLVQEALEHLMKGRTSLVIAHRLSTIRDADRIVVLDKGTVVENGTHEALMALPEGLYRSLSRLQSEGITG
ncbi:MAG: ATP-binding cassette domain-containing protein [Flavobacteriales bacterium]|nr:ATP-binding cassette domain-containing protein [Flavobacteriales bacterium]